MISPPHLWYLNDILPQSRDSQWIIYWEKYSKASAIKKKDNEFHIITLSLTNSVLHTLEPEHTVPTSQH